MFTKIFKSDYIYQLSFIMIAVIVIWIHSFFSLTSLTVFPTLSPFYSVIGNSFLTNNILAVTIAFILLIIQSIMLNMAFSANEMFNRNNYLITFIYFLMMSSSTELYTIHPVLFSSLFLIFSLRNILGIYGKPDSFSSVFNATLFIGISSLFYFPSIYFIVFIWLSFFIYRLYAWREWVISILGLGTPYLYLFSYYFVTDQLKVKYFLYIDFFKSFKPASFHPDKGNYIFFTVVGLMSVYIIFNTLNRLTEKSIYYRKKVLVLTMFLLVAFITLIFSGTFFTYHLCLVFIPLSFFIPIHIIQIKRLVISEMFFIILITAWLLNIIL